jgi:D-serine deaminase-like pyridoxal phosphate-dependent protein
MPLDEVDTPALLVDLDTLEDNLSRMAAVAAAGDVRLRPHAKTHKCADLALRQMALGAVGVCCQKVSEAEALVDAGVSDVLVSNEVVDPHKLVRLAALAERATIGVCVDNAEAIDTLRAAAASRVAEIGVLVEIDVGGNRCGVAPGEPALRLAERIACAPGLHFRGLQAYNGVAQHVRAPADREQAAALTAEAARATAELLRAHGLPTEFICGGGTGTHAFDIAAGVLTEIQPGSYMFMDVDYRANGGPTAFRQSLFVYTQVMSTPGREYTVVDAGLKALSVDSGMPAVEGHPNVKYCRPSDEHGMLANSTFHLGEKLKLIPGHCDPTVNLYDWYVVIRRGRVEALWPITARGATS